ncbi:uncharacterized protein LOC144448559 [Glandiceps talaboti]
MPLLSVLLGAATGHVVGALWYSPLMFAKPWIKCVQKTPEDMMKISDSHHTGIPVSIVSDLTLACVMEYALPRMHLGDTFHTLVVISSGFTLLNLALEAPLYPFEGRPLQLFFINMGYNATRICLMMAVLLMFKN